MKYRICEAEQGTPEWKADRLGCVTGSMADILYMSGKTKGSESVTRINYRYALAEERVTGQEQSSQFISKHMKYGTETEPLARMADEGQSFIHVEQCGFVRLEDMWAGCSLDGMIREGGRIVGLKEYKCPMLKTYLTYIKGGEIPDDYIYQVVHNLWVTGAEWCDFAAFRPGFKLFVKRAYAKDLPIAEHDAAVRKFLAEVAECEAEIRRYAE